MPTSLNIDGAVFRVGGGQPCKVRLGAQSIMDVPGAVTVVSSVAILAGLRPRVMIGFSDVDDGGSPLTKLVLNANGATQEVSVASAARQLGRTRAPTRLQAYTLPNTAAALGVTLQPFNAIGSGPETVAFTAATTTSTTVSFAMGTNATATLQLVDVVTGHSKVTVVTQ
jgi:hypothetical protein